MDLSNLKILDLIILEHLPRSVSIRELARSLKLDGQNLTRKIKTLEDILGTTLVERSTKGIAITEGGRRASEIARKSLEVLSAFQDGAKKDYSTRLKVCGRAYMIDFFVNSLYQSLRSFEPNFTYDLMDESPENTERAARNGLLDVVFSFGEIDPGKNFESMKIFETQWEYVVRKDHPLATGKVDTFDDYTLAGFCYLDGDRQVSTSYACAKEFGFKEEVRCQNTRYSLALAQKSDVVAYVPSLALSAYSSDTFHILNALPKNVQRETRSLHVHLNLDTVSASFKRHLIESFKKLAC